MKLCFNLNCAKTWRSIEKNGAAHWEHVVNKNFEPLPITLGESPSEFDQQTEHLCYFLGQLLWLDVQRYGSAESGP